MFIPYRIQAATIGRLEAILRESDDIRRARCRAIRDLEADLADIDLAVAKLAVERLKSKHDEEEALETALRRMEQALQALNVDQEDLARRALLNKRDYLARVERSRKFRDELEAEQQALLTERQNRQALLTYLENQEADCGIPDAGMLEQIGAAEELPEQETKASSPRRMIMRIFNPSSLKGPAAETRDPAAPRALTAQGKGLLFFKGSLDEELSHLHDILDERKHR